MGDDSQSRNRPEWRSLMRIDGYARDCFTNSAVEKIVFLKAFEVHKISLKASFVATVSTECYRFDFYVFGLIEAFRAACSQTGYRCDRLIQLSQC